MLESLLNKQYLVGQLGVLVFELYQIGLVSAHEMSREWECNLSPSRCISAAEKCIFRSVLDNIWTTYELYLPCRSANLSFSRGLLVELLLFLAEDIGKVFSRPI